MNTPENIEGAPETGEVPQVEVEISEMRTQFPIFTGKASKEVSGPRLQVNKNPDGSIHTYFYSNN